MYVKIISWHIVLTPTRVSGRYRTVCGRNASGPVADSFGSDKTCETCLRIAKLNEG